MTNSEAWYIVKQSTGHCEIIQSKPETLESEASASDDVQERDQWGPFDSQAEAIARRVGLIRSGKCQPL